MGYEQLPRELEEFLDKSSLYIKMTKSRKLSSYLFYAINIKSIKLLEKFLKILDEEVLEAAKKKILENNPTNRVVEDEIISNAKKIAFDELCKKAFITKVSHNIFYYRTPLELCIYHYSQCSDYQSKSKEAKKVTNDVKEALDSSLSDTKDFWDYTKGEDFKIAKEFIEAILNSARKNEVLGDVLIASGIRKDLAKKLSDGKYSNDDIINVLQKNQKAEERGTVVGIVSWCIALPTVILLCIKCAEISTGWSVTIGIVGSVVIACGIGCYTYKLSQPNTKILEINTNQGVYSGRQPV
jgi:hypothetical protein